MKAIMLAAGLGSRLSGNDHEHPPKSLLRFGGMTLLERHLKALKTLGISQLHLVVGYHREDLLDALGTLDPDGFVKPVHNPFFHEGALVSFWTARDVLRSGDDILFMDADVLYHPDILEKLVKSPHANCLLVDQDLDPGDEPVKLCVRDGRIVDFGKQVEGTFDLIGEWPGFLKLESSMAARFADMAQTYLDRNLAILPYEPAFREAMLEAGTEDFGFEDITGLPWIEIDFLEDMARATEEILPRLPY